MKYVLALSLLFSFIVNAQSDTSSNNDFKKASNVRSDIVTVGKTLRLKGRVDPSCDAACGSFPKIDEVEVKIYRIYCFATDYNSNEFIEFSRGNPNGITISQNGEDVTNKYKPADIGTTKLKSDKTFSIAFHSGVAPLSASGASKFPYATFNSPLTISMRHYINDVQHTTIQIPVTKAMISYRVVILHGEEGNPYCEFLNLQQFGKVTFYNNETEKDLGTLPTSCYQRIGG